MSIEGMLDAVRGFALSSWGAGAAGDFAAFLHNVRKGRVRNNKYIRKLLLEVAGGCLVAGMLSPAVGKLIGNKVTTNVGCFFLGLAWAEVVGIARGAITKRAEQLSGDVVDKDS